MQYVLEKLFQVRKDKFKAYTGVIQELDLVEEADKITHNVGIDEELECEEEINFFRFDEQFATKEIEWDEIKKEIVGEYFDQPKEEEKEYGSDDEVVVSN